MRTAVVDVGGGLRGVYATGVLDRCLEEGVRFDAGVGVSAGSANIASYLAGQKGRNYQFYAEYSSRKEYMSVAQRYGKAGRVDSMLSLHLFPLYLRQPQQVLHVGENHLRLLLAPVLQPLLDKGEKACPEEGEVIGNGLLLYGEPPQQGPHIPLQKLAESPVPCGAGPCFGRGRPGRNPGCPGCAPKWAAGAQGIRGAPRRSCPRGNGLSGSRRSLAPSPPSGPQCCRSGCKRWSGSPRPPGRACSPSHLKYPCVPASAAALSFSRSRVFRERLLFLVFMA